MSTPQIRCPNCKTSMPYTAASCPNCNRRMVEVAEPATELTPEERAAQWAPEWADGKKPGNSNVVGAVIAALVLVGMFLLCVSSGKESPEDRRARERYEEMKPLHDAMDRKMREGKTREKAAQKIVKEKPRRKEEISAGSRIAD